MDLQAILNASEAMAKNIIPVITGPMAVCTGLYLVGSAIVEFIKVGDYGGAGERQHTPFAAFMKLLMGALMLQLGPTISAFSWTFLGSGVQDYHNVLAYIPLPAGGGAFWKQVVEIVVLWLVMFGWVAAFRGVLCWHSAASGNGNGQNGDQFWKGVWHVLGGVCAINLPGFFSGFLGK